MHLSQDFELFTLRHAGFSRCFLSTYIVLHDFGFDCSTCVNVVRCLLRAGVGHEAVVGVCPACCGPRAGDSADVPLVPLLVPPGSGFSFLNAPSAVEHK